MPTLRVQERRLKRQFLARQTKGLIKPIASTAVDSSNKLGMLGATLPDRQLHDGTIAVPRIDINGPTPLDLSNRITDHGVLFRLIGLIFASSHCVCI